MPDWKKIKAEYLRGGCSHRKLAEKYGVSVSTLSKVAMREKWSELRKETGMKLDAKLADSVARREAEREDLFGAISDKLLKMISDGIDDGSIAIACRGRGFRDITGALKDLREIKGIRPELDVEEQQARIQKLKQDAQADVAKDTQITVLMPGGTEDFAK